MVIRRLAGLALIVGLALGVSPHPLARTATRSIWLDVAVRQARATDVLPVWVYFSDKGAAAASRALASSTGVTSRAAQRRLMRGDRLDRSVFEDRPVRAEYVTAVGRTASALRHTSRWLNAVSALATPTQIDALAALPFVSRVDIVRGYRRGPREALELLDPTPQPSRRLDAQDEPLDYGAALRQVEQIRVPELHQRGLHGEGVVIAVLDSGFQNLGHEAFSALQIVAEHDFVKGRDDVRESIDDHGTATLSTLGGYAPGQLIGPAFRARYILAVTEDIGSETPVEEDHWVAAAEWAESLGADVISSSLGYLDFDRPFTSYTDRDMDGQTAVVTRAAALAAERGVVVVNSAGNSGAHPSHNTLGAPADGVRVLTVGAVNSAGSRTSFSSVGPTADGRTKPDVMAMGQGVRVATAVENRYANAAGTSFSCPLTAGVVALVLQAHPDYTVDQVLTVVRSSASAADAPDNLVGWGLVDAVRAVDVEVPAAAPARLLPTQAAGSGSWPSAPR